MSICDFCDFLKKYVLEKDLVITPNSRLVEDLNLCSFDLMVIIDAFERKSKTKCLVNKLLNIKTVIELYNSFVEVGEDNG